jgi:ubiquinol-cytochrome c reductase subunit 7
LVNDLVRLFVLGLLRDDTIIETPVVKEAIRRLPSHLKDARTMRMKRALDLSMKQAVLPEELQPTEKDDIGYLVPYILEVEREWAYRRAFRLE